MSISSCPRCAKQVTLPVGVSDSAQVRCPLCHAQYALADALVNMPPLLEVIEAGADGGDDWFNLTPDEQEDSGSSQSAVLPAELAGESADTPVKELAQTIDVDDLSFQPKSVDHDDLVMQEKDTEIEELSFSIDEAGDSESAAPAALPLDLDGPEGNLFDAPPAEPQSGEAVSEPVEEFAAQEPLDFGEPLAEPAEAAAAEEPSIDLDFGEPAAEAPTFEEETREPSLDFGEPVTAAEGGDDLPEFGEPDFSSEFNEGEAVASETAPAEMAPAEMSAGEDEIGLDFGEPVAEPASAEDTTAEAPSDEAPADAKADKKKKKKEKKEKKPREPKATKEGKRSLMGTVVSLLIVLIVAAPLAIYSLLWLGPDADYFKVARFLPGAILPSSFKTKAARPPIQVAQLPPAQPAQPTLPPPSQPQQEQPAAAPAEPGAEQPPATAGETPADQPGDANPPTEAAAAPEQTAPEQPTPEPAEPAAAPELAPPSNAAPADAEKIPKEEPPAPAAEPADAPPEPPAAEEPADDTKPAAADAPEEMPAEEAATDKDVADAEALFASDDKEKPADKPAEEAAPAEAAEDTEPAGPRDAPSFSAADVTKALELATVADQRMMAAQEAKDEAAIKKARKDFYLSWYGLADTLTFAKDDAELNQRRKAVEQLVRALVADKRRLEAVAYNGPRWLAFNKRTTTGIMLAGSVEAVEQIGKLYCVEMKMGAAADSPVITVVSAADPHLAPGDETVTLGSIVEHPDERLNGYSGSGATVVWSGMTLKVSDSK